MLSYQGAYFDAREDGTELHIGPTIQPVCDISPAVLDAGGSASSQRDVMLKSSVLGDVGGGGLAASGDIVLATFSEGVWKIHLNAVVRSNMASTVTDKLVLRSPVPNDFNIFQTQIRSTIAGGLIFDWESQICFKDAGWQLIGNIGIIIATELLSFNYSLYAYRMA